jgi:signal transduction histidine kinase
VTNRLAGATGWLSRSPQRDLSSGSDNGPVLRIANFGVRAVLLILVGVSAFTGPWPGTAEGGMEVVAFTVATALLALLVPADRTAPVRDRCASALPWVLGTIALFCGAASAVPRGSLFIILGFTAAISAGSDTSVAAGCAVVASAIGATEAAGLALGAGSSVTVDYPILLVLALVLGRNLGAHRLRAEQSGQLAERQATLATLHERARIAREIHDVLAHSLGALAVQIQVARAVLTDQHDETRAVALLDHAQRMATDGLQETRRAVHALRGDTLPLPEVLVRLGADHQRRYGTSVAFEVEGEPYPLAADAALSILRTAQEALVNTAKHAPRQPVECHLGYVDAGTSLVVRNHMADDITNAEPSPLATMNGNFGLAGMRERLLLLGGTLSAGRQDGDWVVVATLPR